MTSDPTLKRPVSAISETMDIRAPKRLKRAYHHGHRLRHPVTPLRPEPAITDVACIDSLLNRILGQSLMNAGFDLADPVALDGFRSATEECKQ